MSQFFKFGLALVAKIDSGKRLNEFGFGDVFVCLGNFSQESVYDANISLNLGVGVRLNLSEALVRRVDFFRKNLSFGDEELLFSDIIGFDGKTFPGIEEIGNCVTDTATTRARSILYGSRIFGAIKKLTQRDFGAFGTAHRAHASTAVIARFFPTDKLFGYLMEDEVQSIDRVLNSTAKPVTAIIGGSKVSSKITILENLLNRVDNIVIGGGMAYTFFKALGGNTGNSLVEDDKLELAKALLEKAKEKGVNIYLPEDSIIADAFSNDAERMSSESRGIPTGWMGLDIGEQSIARFSEVILNSKVILWNGPMGVFEMSNFSQGTIAIAQALVSATKNGAFTLVGGGDSVAAINQFGLADEVSYVSTGGGAMLEALEGIDLPGIAAIKS